MSLEEKIKKLKGALKDWAKPFKTPAKQRIEARKLLEQHQLLLEDQTINVESLEKEASLQRSLHASCRTEEYWRQKSRCLWLKSGDKNTSFFHKQAEGRKQYKAVKEIHKQDQIIQDFDEIKQVAHEHLKNIYTEERLPRAYPSSPVLNLIPSVINQATNTAHIALVSIKEIKKALTNMEPNKAPGQDGFTARFLKSCWKTIKFDLHKMVLKSQACNKICGSTNSAFLALMPKEKGATSFDRFRPISLCNIGYKIITKVIANRLKDVLPRIIPENQGGL